MDMNDIGTADIHVAIYVYMYIHNLKIYMTLEVVAFTLSFKSQLILHHLIQHRSSNL